MYEPLQEACNSSKQVTPVRILVMLAAFAGYYYESRPLYSPSNPHVLKDILLFLSISCGKGLWQNHQLDHRPLVGCGGASVQLGSSTVLARNHGHANWFHTDNNVRFSPTTYVNASNAVLERAPVGVGHNLLRKSVCSLVLVL